MRTMNKETIYLSDVLAMPLPARAASRKDYLRRLRHRRLMWRLLPWCLEALGLLALVLLTMTGVGVFALSLGG